MKRKSLISIFLLLALLCQAVLCAADQSDQLDQSDQILDLAKALEAESGKLRTVSVRVYNSEDPRLPAEGEAPDTAFLKDLSIGLENRWTIAAGESADMQPTELLDLCRQYTAAELDSLEKYRDVRMSDALRSFLCQAYITWLDRQTAVLEDTTNPVDTLWRWNEARQEGIKTLFFLNRYYGVYVHPSFKDSMNSFLYEGAMLVQEDTIEKMVEVLLEQTAAFEEPAEQTPDEETVTGVKAEPAAEEIADAGPEIWHLDPASAYEFRIYDFDSEKLFLKAELRNQETGKLIPCGEINLSSIWEKYKKNRQTVDTFYKVDGIEDTDGKISFNVYANVRFDGRLYQEIRGRISLKLPQADENEDVGESESDVTESGFPEDPIGQDFSDLKVGSHLFMGYYEQDGNTENLREPIEWMVISLNQKKNVGLIISVMGLEAISYGWPGKVEEETATDFNWETSYLRTWLSEEFYEHAFTDAEKDRIRLATNVTKDASGRFTTKDYVFPLKTDEAKLYLHSKEGMACEPTQHAKEGLGPDGIVEEKYCLWWLRELTKAVKVNRDGSLKENTWNEAGYVSGSTGMRFYYHKTGMKVYEDRTVVVRPAMWVKFGAGE